NNQIETREHETHFYMYAPEHKERERTLHVGRLEHIYLEGDRDKEGLRIDRTHLRIPKMYDLANKPDKVMYYFELTQIRPESSKESLSLDELDNLLIYPDMTFLDLV